MNLHLELLYAVSYTNAQPSPKDAKEAAISAEKDDQDDYVLLADVFIHDFMDLLRERAIIINFLTHDYKHVSFFMALIQRNVLWNARLDEVIHWQIALLVLQLGFSLHASQITRSIGQIVQVLVELRLIELARGLLVPHREGKTFISERPMFFEMLSARQNSEIYFIQLPCVCNSDKRYLKLGDEVRHQVFQVSLFILD